MQVVIKNLTYKYNIGTPFETTALDNVSLNIEEGEFIGIIGHTGSGKSTFIQNLNALIKPNNGSVLIDDIDIFKDKQTMFDVKFKVGLVFQYPEHQLFEATVFEDVAFGPKNLGFSDDEIYNRVKNALTLVGLDKSYFDKSPFDLSGGQKRKVAIAGVLAMQPKILILDEPTAGLDPKSRTELLTNIKKMHTELGITILLVSHSMEDVAMLVDRIIVFSEGKIYLDNNVLEVFSKTEELQKIGLNSPEIFLLIKKLNENGFTIEENIFTVDDATDVLTKLFKGDNK